MVAPRRGGLFPSPITNVMPAKAGLQEQTLAEERELLGPGLRRPCPDACVNALGRTAVRPCWWEITQNSKNDPFAGATVEMVAPGRGGLAIDYHRRMHPAPGGVCTKIPFAPQYWRAATYVASILHI